MSLFKVRDLWSTKCGKDEEFDLSSLLVADILGQNYDCIIVGSLSGCLRIFNPHYDLESQEHENFKPIDLLIEVQLQEPILQLAIGKFVSGSKSKYLAILHPRSIAVYNVITVAGSTEHGDQCQISIVYEHHLKRSAYNFVSGGFGGVEGRDFICVQGLDGMLMFYEQETLSTTKQLGSFLLPSPIVYIPHTDSFILINSNWHIESFRYQVLGEDTSDHLLSSWSFNLGEDVVDIKYISLTTTEAGIFVLTERNFYCFTETGVIKFTKRLQYVPLCCYVYSRGEPTVMSMIVTDSNSLLVYENSKLLWAAQLHLCPIAVARASLQSLKGCLVLLSEDGELECGYLGSEPTVFVPPPLQSSVTSNSELETKLASLQHQIAAYSKYDKEALGAPVQKPEVKLSTKVWGGTEDQNCVLEISLSASSTVHNANISIEVRKPLRAEPASHFIQSITDSCDVSSRISSSEGIVWDLECNVSCAYLIGDKCGVSTTSVQLPLWLVLRLAAPVRGLDISLNFSASQVAILPALFTDFSAESWNKTNSNEYSAGFEYRNNPELSFTISLNRPGLKYRLEGDSLLSLTLPVVLLSKKLASKHLRTSQYSVGLDILFSYLEENISLRNRIREIEEELREGTGQMRAAQRRLLSKMRDKTPSDMKPLTALIDYTHNYVMEAAHKMEAAQNELEKNGYNLGNIIKFTLTMIKHSGSASTEEVDMLYEAMSYTEHFSENQGWAEITQVALTHLLKTTLARSVRDQFTSEPLEEVVKKSFSLKKQIATAFDRIVKGQRRTDDRAVSPIPEGDDEEGRDKTENMYDELESEEIKKILQESQLNLDHL